VEINSRAEFYERFLMAARESDVEWEYARNPSERVH